MKSNGLSIKLPLNSPTLVLHIGGPKCGSSALQKFLIDNPLLETVNGAQIEYCTFRFDNNLTPVFRSIANDKFSDSLELATSSRFRQQLDTQCLHKIFEEFIHENDFNSKKYSFFLVKDGEQIFKSQH
jgi:hypothetical protein